MASFLTACNSVKPKPAASAGVLPKFQASAAKYNSIITIPTFETTTNEIQATLTKTIATGDDSLDRIGKLGAGEGTFANTFVALDDLGFQIGMAANRLSVIEQTSTNAEARDAVTETLKKISEWSVGID